MWISREIPEENFRPMFRQIIVKYAADYAFCTTIRSSKLLYGLMWYSLYNLRIKLTVIGAQGDIHAKILLDKSLVDKE